MNKNIKQLEAEEARLRAIALEARDRYTELTNDWHKAKQLVEAARDDQRIEVEVQRRLAAKEQAVY